MDMDRRGVLLGAIAVAVSSKAAASNPILAAGVAKTPAQRCARLMASALRSIGSDRCVAEAERLESLGPTHGAVALHLRKFGLGAADATLIAGALERLTPDEAAALSSFSISYNAGVGDDGAAALAKALPADLPEIGFVGCALGDPAGQALLGWAKAGDRPKMICVEGNRFSADLRDAFRHVARQRSGTTVIV
jgi:hypothetical protein